MIWRLLDLTQLLAGAAAIVIGVAQWSRPAAWVVAGGLLIASAMIPAKR